MVWSLVGMMLLVIAAAVVSVVDVAVAVVAINVHQVCKRFINRVAFCFVHHCVLLLAIGIVVVVLQAVVVVGVVLRC